MSERSELLSTRYQGSIQIINKGQDDEAVCFGYQKNTFKTILFYLIIILSGGSLILLFHWKPEWRLYFTCSLKDLSIADYVLIQDQFRRFAVVNINRLDNINNQVDERLYQSVPYDQSTSSRTDRVDASIKYFIYQTLRYTWNKETKLFERLNGYDVNTKCLKLLNEFKGYSQSVQEEKLNYYGQNTIEVQVKSYFRLFFEEILTPFYIFQIMACALWLTDEYYYYAVCIIVISAISMILSLFETKRQSKTLHDMVQTHIRVRVCRGPDIFDEVPSEQLVPGDVIEIPSNHQTMMSCDAILLNGNCIVNESMLTGESVPVIKTPLPTPDDRDEIYDVEIHKRSTLFNGTKVLQTRNYDSPRVLAVVVRTGFNTSKGELVRSILYPKPMGFKFYEDSLKFILFLFGVAVVGMAYGIYVLAKNGVDAKDIIIRALDIVTIVVPPALPAAMTVGTVYAQNRLKKRSIYCISPPRINVGGKLKLICFDKTGTLTEDGLDLWGTIDLDDNNNFNHPVHDITILRKGNLLKALATCHSLTRFDGSLTGDPLDVKMFESTKWAFIDEQTAGSCKFEQVTPVVRQNKDANPKNQSGEPMEIAIIKQFTFSSSLLRMSVLCKTLETDYLEVFTKGAPEKIAELSRPETIPESFNELLKTYTANGYRVIALAGKMLDPSITWINAQKLSRESIESDLTFYGLLIMQNMIKPETTPIIRELHNANITTVMVTGDNLLTALCVARKCGMVPERNKVILIEAHTSNDDSAQVSSASGVPARIEWKLAENLTDLDNFDFNRNTYQSGYNGNTNIQSVIDVESSDNYSFAMTGKTFAILKRYFPKIFEKVLVNGTIYARMSPDQKAQLVEHLISIGYCVSMCGDGANDCSALKAAHVGISLSEAEASVASPFTSKIQNISCVPEVIKEGRAALVTSFGVFKYMALYSMIQFTSVLILYTILTNLADSQFLYVDLFLITPVAVFMSANKAYDKLGKKRPLGSLVGFVNVFSILSQVVLVIAFQIGVFIYLKQQSWFIPNNPDVKHFKENNKNMENTTVFLISTFQYVIMAFVFSKGPPFRRPISDNFSFLVALLFLTACNVWITITPTEFIKNWLSMQTLDPQNDISIFRCSIVVVALAFFLISYFIEEVVVSSQWFKRLGQIIMRKKQPKNRYKIIKKELERDSDWPNIGKITFEDK